MTSTIYIISAKNLTIFNLINLSDILLKVLDILFIHLFLCGLELFKPYFSILSDFLSDLPNELNESLGVFY
jgi:hypothetical protein